MKWNLFSRVLTEKKAMCW